VIGGESTGVVGHERALAGTDLAHELEHAVERIALDVEFRAGPLRQDRRQLAHVVGPHVSAVRTGMNRDAVGAGAQSEARRAHHAGNADGARISQ